MNRWIITLDFIFFFFYIYTIYPAQRKAGARQLVSYGSYISKVEFLTVVIINYQYFKKKNGNEQGIYTDCIVRKFKSKTCK